MKAFTELYASLDETTKTSAKIAALVQYFSTAAAEDAAWAIYFLSGRKPRRLIAGPKLRQWIAEEAGIPDWMFEECYSTVGDLAETISLLLPDELGASDLPLHRWITERLLPLRDLTEEEQRDRVVTYWRELDARQRMIFNKLITGGFRVGVSQQMVARGLAQVSGLPVEVITHRLMGDWQPVPEFIAALLGTELTDAEPSRPYPFFLAHQLGGPPENLGPIQEWQAEWKWDGIRAQAIKRGGEAFLWSRGEELITDRFPEIAEMAMRLPDGTVMDGEILPRRDGEVLPFAALQKRIGRKTLTKRLLAEVPVALVAYDLLELDGADLRAMPLAERRARLESLYESHGREEPAWLLSDLVRGESWEHLAQQREESRARKVEGLMLKRLASPYRTGRQRGDWWKWKIDPYTVDAVLIYAQRGHGRRATLYTDYTFAVWNEGELVPFAKAYSGLSDPEIDELDAWIRKHTRESFGPVRSVEPLQVFELAFEGIQLSTRHKSGIATRFPRILRWRRDKPAAEADTLATVKGLIG